MNFIVMDIDKYLKYTQIKIFNGDKWFSKECIDNKISNLNKFSNMIKNNEQFIFVKFGDGEFNNMLSNNENDHNCDYNKYYRELGNQLIKSYIYFLKEEKTYIAKWLNEYELRVVLEKEFLKTNEEDKFIDYDILNNIVPILKEQIEFYNIISNSSRKKLYISNGNMCNIVKKILKVDCCIEIPQNNVFLIKDEIINQIKKEITDNSIIMFSAGMCSKVLIHELSEYNKNATYIDIGSAFDGFVRLSRDWHLVPNYSQIIYESYKNLLEY